MVKRPALWLCGLGLALATLSGCQCCGSSGCSLWGNRQASAPKGPGYAATHSASSATVQGWNTRTAPASAGVPVSSPVATSATSATSSTANAPGAAGMVKAPAAPAATTSLPPASELVMPERRMTESQAIMPATHVAPAVPDRLGIDLEARPQIDPPTPKEQPSASGRLAPVRPSEPVEPRVPLAPQLEPPPATSKVQTVPAEAADPDAVPPPSLPKLLPPPSDGTD